MVRLAEYGTKLMGWYPLGHGDPGLLHDPMITKLSDKYRKSTVQILLRWAVQRDFMTIPGTKNIDHLRSNFDIFDFSLTDEEMAAVNALNGTRRYYTPSEELELVMPICICPLKADRRKYDGICNLKQRN